MSTWLPCSRFLLMDYSSNVFVCSPSLCVWLTCILLNSLKLIWTYIKNFSNYQIIFFFSRPHFILYLLMWMVSILICKFLWDNTQYMRYWDRILSTIVLASYYDFLTTKNKITSFNISGSCLLIATKYRHQLCIIKLDDDWIIWSVIEIWKPHKSALFPSFPLLFLSKLGKSLNAQNLSR